MGKQGATEHVEKACGCIPFMRERDRGLIGLMILRSGGYWEFPKGKQEKDETDEETALRELYEETKLVGVITPDEVISLTYLFDRDGVPTRKEVTYFFCRVADGSVATVDRREANDHAWLPLEELADRATYPEMKDAARQVVLTLAD